MRRLLAAAVMAILLHGTAAAQTAGVRIRGVEVESYPLVEVTASIRTTDPFQSPTIRLTENGRPVSPTSVVPLGPSGGSVDVVLALDTSNSMRGRPLEAAFAAARTFLEDLPPWVRVGVLTFAGQPHVVAEITVDRVAVVEALSSAPATERGTAVYGAVAAASEMFSSGAQRNIVLLTDGRDTTGREPTDAIQAARRAGVTIFAVRLEEADTNDSILESLASGTSGAYVSASASDLRAVYTSLAGQLSQQYVITYRTEAPPGSEATISVQGDGGEDAVLIRFPGQAAAPAERGPQGLLVSLLGARWALPVLLVVWYAAILSVIWMLFGGAVRARRDRELAARMMAVDPPVASAGDRDGGKRSATQWIPAPLAGLGEQLARATGLSAAIDRHLERAALPVRTGEFVVATLGAALFGSVLGGLVTRNILFAAPFVLVGAAAPFVAISVAASKRAEKLHAQLPDVLMVLASSLRAGHSFLQALDMVAKEVSPPASQEFTRAVTEIRLGRPVEDALVAMAERVRSDDFGWAVLAINIQRQVGGNLAEILENVADTIRQRAALRRQIRALSAEGRLSVAILVALPPALAVYISFVNPLYIATLFGTTPGRFLMVGATFLMILGFLWMRKVVRLNV